MSVALKNVARLSALTLLVAGLSGCGAESPTGPSLVTTTTVETSASMMPVEALPAPGEGIETPTLIENPGGSTSTGNKTLWSERPGRRVGKGRNK